MISEEITKATKPKAVLTCATRRRITRIEPKYSLTKKFKPFEFTRKKAAEVSKMNNTAKDMLKTNLRKN
ncbi:MAG TPA: hypothetical protein DIT91_00335, partial [Actinobacteria bacterium]|nr:hypothetical protein [Actinomycetota bacterium]